MTTQLEATYLLGAYLHLCRITLRRWRRMRPQRQREIASEIGLSGDQRRQAIATLNRLERFNARTWRHHRSWRLEIAEQLKLLQDVQHVRRH